MRPRPYLTSRRTSILSLLKPRPLKKSLKELKNNRPYKLIVIGDDPKLSSPYDLFPMNQIRDVFNFLREKYGGAEVEDVSQDNCVSMPGHLFLHFTALPFDVFLKIQQGNEAKYIKRFNANEPLEHDAINKYPGAPQEVDKIIIQHQGSMNGFGLNRYPTGGTLLSSQILFYSQDLALRILNAHGKKLKEILQEFSDEFKDAPQTEVVIKFLKSFQQDNASIY